MTETRDLAIVLEVGALAGVGQRRPPKSPTVNTADANLGLVVDQARLASLPLIHGDPYKIMGLAPGLAHSGSQRLDRPVRADAHRRLRLPGHAQQPQRPAD